MLLLSIVVYTGLCNVMYVYTFFLTPIHPYKQPAWKGWHERTRGAPDFQKIAHLRTFWEITEFFSASEVKSWKGSYCFNQFQIVIPSNLESQISKLI